MASKKLDLIVVGGFLGSGKTTFINDFLLRADLKTCIIENEVGRVNLDKDYFKDNWVFDLNSGCICCDINNELTDVLEKLKDYDVDLIIVEPTGIADLMNLRNLIPDCYNTRIITIVDAMNFDRFSINFKDFYMKQIMDADQVYVNRGKIEGFRDYTSDCGVSLEEILTLNSREARESTSNRPDLAVKTLKNLSFKSKEDFEAFLDKIDKKAGLVRAKGDIDIDGEHFRFNYTSKLEYGNALSENLNTVIFTESDF